MPPREPIQPEADEPMAWVVNLEEEVIEPEWNEENVRRFSELSDALGLALHKSWPSEAEKALQEVLRQEKEEVKLSYDLPLERVAGNVKYHTDLAMGNIVLGKFPSSDLAPHHLLPLLKRTLNLVRSSRGY